MAHATKTRMETPARTAVHDEMPFKKGDRFYPCGDATGLYSYARRRPFLKTSYLCPTCGADDPAECRDHFLEDPQSEERSNADGWYYTKISGGAFVADIEETERERARERELANPAVSVARVPEREGLLTKAFHAACRYFFPEKARVRPGDGEDTLALGDCVLELEGEESV